jgi:outer membrane protein
MRTAALVTTLLLGVVSTADAQPLANWNITVGPGLIIGPSYEGSDKTSLTPFPWLSLSEPGSPPVFAAPDDSPGFGLLSGPIRVGVVFGFRGERDSAGKRVGLRSVDWALEPGLSLDVWPIEWLRVRAELRKGITGHSGWVADFGGDVVDRNGPWTLAAGPRFGYGSSKYMEKYFGVTAAEALANPTITTAFSPDAGLRYWGGAAAIIHQDGRWQELAGVAYHRLAGDAGDSPVVSQLGNQNQLIFTLGVTYTFGPAT